MLRIKGASIYWLPESVDAILLLRSFYKSGRWNCLQRMADDAGGCERETGKSGMRPIERMQTGVTVPRVAQALDRHRPEGRLQLPVVQPPLRTLDAVGDPSTGTRCLPRAALVEVPGCRSLRISS